MLIRQHISPKERNYKTNFRSESIRKKSIWELIVDLPNLENLQMIREALSATDSPLKRKRRNLVKTENGQADMIDSDEEL